MPVHMMQTSYLPNVVCSKLDSLNRKFLWGAIDKRKVHLCKWDHVCQPKFSGGLGLRHASCSNLAFMAKIGWGLINNSDDLWVCVLHSKYRCGNDIIPQVRSSKGSSNLWRGVCRAWPMVENNVIWRIGDGKKIKFWSDRWLPQIDYLSSHALVNLTDGMLETKVADFVTSDDTWNWHILCNLLPSHICEFIAGLAPPSPLAGLDVPAWKGSHDGNFSIKSAYSLFANHDEYSLDPLFRLI